MKQNEEEIPEDWTVSRNYEGVESIGPLWATADADDDSGLIAWIDAPDHIINFAAKACSCHNELLSALKNLLKHEGEREFNGVFLEGDSDNLEKAKIAARAAIERAEE